MSSVVFSCSSYRRNNLSIGRCCTGIVAYLAIGLTLSSSADETVYDNMHVPHRNELFFPQEGQYYVAQPFELGDNNAVTSVELAIARKTFSEGVTGTMDLSIWSDDGEGAPGQPVAMLGTIDVTTLTELSTPPFTLDTVVFDTLVTGLTPSETYFVVGDASNVDGLSPQGEAILRTNSIFQAFLSTDEGTNGAAELLVADDSPDWYSLRPMFGSRHLQMAVYATDMTTTRSNGDFDGDGQLTALDLEALTSAMSLTEPAAEFDLNGDGNVDNADHRVWIVDLAGTWFGDANLSGEFDSGDMVEVFKAGKYESASNATWSEGDWNADTVFNSSDLIAAFQDGGYELGPRSSSAAVPESSSGSLLVVGLICSSVGRWKRK